MIFWLQKFLNLMVTYEFEPANHPGNVTHGGVGIFYKVSLPVTPRRDLSFDESLVLEPNFGRKKNFFYCPVPKPCIYFTKF